MDISKVARILILVFVISTSVFGVSRAEDCETIRFKRGESSGSVSGVVPPDKVICYQMTTGLGQTAIIRVMAGQNIIFSIDDEIDGQDSYRFTTEKKTYKVRVGQLMRSVTDESFTLSVSIE